MMCKQQRLKTIVDRLELVKWNNNGKTVTYDGEPVMTIVHGNVTIYLDPLKEDNHLSEKEIDYVLENLIDRYLHVADLSGTIRLTSVKYDLNTPEESHWREVIDHQLALNRSLGRD